MKEKWLQKPHGPPILDISYKVFSFSTEYLRVIQLLNYFKNISALTESLRMFIYNINVTKINNINFNLT